MEIGERIIAVARHYNMNMSQFAVKMGLGRATIHTYTTGSKNRPPAKPPAETIALIVQCFPEISAKWILTGEGEMISAKTDNQKEIKDFPSKELNVDFKEKYYEASDKIINLQEKLIAAHQDLISCLKSKNSRSLETVH